MSKHDHYFRLVPNGVKKIDVYRFLEMFGVTCPVAQHVIKKAVAAGQRGHKDLKRDWNDIIDSGKRKLEMLAEVESQVDAAGLPANYKNVRIEADGNWPEETERIIDQIGQNGEPAGLCLDSWDNTPGRDELKTDIQFQDGIITQ